MRTIVFFRHRNEGITTEISAFEETALAALQKCDCDEIRVLPHLYDLPEEESLKDVRQSGGDLHAISWLSQRACYWLLRKHGFDGEIRCCVDLLPLFQSRRQDDLPERFVSLLELPPRGDESVTPIRQVELPSLKRRWYPVLDRDACTGCLECVNYCLFGVYEIAHDELPCVVHPDACRDGCPACSRVCPGGAIVFPEYEDPIISGRKSRQEDARLEPKSTLEDLIDAVDEGFEK